MARIAQEELTREFDEREAARLVNCLKNMAGKREAGAISIPVRNLGCALECLSMAADTLNSLFQLLCIPVDKQLFQRMSFNVLLDLNSW